MKHYRNTGAKGALLDEYEKALDELQYLIKDLSVEQLTSIVDRKTTDADCVSIQSILSHIVRAGHNYVIVIRKNKGEDLAYRKSVFLESASAYEQALKHLMQYTEQLFADYPKLVLEQNEVDKKILVSWGQRYDVEQLMEHAIVHILRHRRQIERFLIQLKAS